MLSELQRLRNEAQQYTNEALQYRHEMLMIRDEILSFKNIPQPFSNENYQCKIGDDLSDDDDGIDIEEIIAISDNDNKEIIEIDNADIDEEIIEIDNADIDEKIIKTGNIDIDEEIKDNIDNPDTDEEIEDNIDTADIDEEIENNIDNADIDEEIIEIDNDSKETIELKDERSIHIEMINNQISQVNRFSLVRNMSARNTREIGKLMIELREDNICDDRIYDDPWLKLNELQKMNILIDEAFDNA